RTRRSDLRTPSHYPLGTDSASAVLRQEHPPLDTVGLRVQVPDFMTEIVATVSQTARYDSHVNQRSGVSVRLSISNYETLVANAARRALRLGEKDVVPRVSDLESLASSPAGNVDIGAL